MNHHVFILPQFESTEDYFEIDCASSVVVGRGDVFGIADKNVSRSQALIDVSGDADVTLTCQGLNPIHVLHDGVDHVVSKGDSMTLTDGDVFHLIENKFAFLLEVEVEVDGSEDSATQPLSDNEDTATSSTSTVVNADLCYRFIHQKSNQRAIATTRFDPDQWLSWFGHYVDRKNYKEAAVRGMRIAIMLGVFNVVRAGLYELPDGNFVRFNKQRLLDSLRQGVMYNEFQFQAQVAARRLLQPGRIIVKALDCLDAANWLANEKKCNPCVLNMANQTRPGGGYRTGAGAQEENLHRRSNLFQHLEDVDSDWPERPWTYPIPEFGAIYSSDVAVFRGSEDAGYPFLDVVEYYSVVSVAADFKPSLFEKTREDGMTTELRLMPEFAVRLKKKIKMLLGVCVAHGHDAVVLSALGCGAFRNPPKHVAELFREVIKEHGFHYQFKYIFFAIFDDHNSYKSHNPEGNFKPFHDVFYQKKSNH